MENIKIETLDDRFAIISIYLPLTIYHSFLEIELFRSDPLGLTVFLKNVLQIEPLRSGHFTLVQIRFGN